MIHSAAARLARNESDASGSSEARSPFDRRVRSVFPPGFFFWLTVPITRRTR